MWVLTEIINLVFSIALFINALLFIPQALKIVKEKTSKAISLPMFSGFLLIQLSAVLYGIIHKDKVIAIGYLLSMLTCGAVVCLTLYFKPKIPKNNFYPNGSPDEMSQKLETLENILALMPGNVYWVNKENVYQGCNDNQAKSSGLNSRFEIIGKKNKDLPWNINAGSLPNDLDKINSEVMDHGRTIVIEEPATLKDGKEITYLSTKTPLRKNNQEIIGMVGISVDITQLKKTEIELITQKEKAEASGKAKSEFLRNMEHQLRTPFSGVYSLVQMLAESETNHEKKELLDLTWKSAKEFLDLLNDIINFSRNNAEYHEIIDKKFDLKNLIEKIVIMEQATAKSKGLSLNFDYAHDLPTVFISDPIRLRRIILNILSNALRFTETGGVTINVKPGKKIDEKNLILQLIISDSGIGISSQNQLLIYEKFFRVHPANQNKYLGAGLGLHVVKELINDLDGEIEVISAVNKGTTFICTLPLKRPLIDDILSDDYQIGD